MRTQIEYMRAEQSRKRSFAVRNDYKRDGAYTLISLYLTYFCLSCIPQIPPDWHLAPLHFLGARRPLPHSAAHVRVSKCRMSTARYGISWVFAVKRTVSSSYPVRPNTVSPDVLQVYDLASSAAYAITHASSPPTTGSAVLQGLVRAMGSRTTRWMTFLLALALACPIPHPLDRASGVCICTVGTSVHVPTLLVRPAGGLREAVCQPGRAKHSTCAFRVWKGVSLVGLPPVVNASLVEYRAP